MEADFYFHSTYLSITSSGWSALHEKYTAPLLIGSNWTKLWDPDYRGGRHKRILHGSNANLLKLMKFAALV